MRHTLVFHVISLAKRIQKVIGFREPPLSLSYSQASALLIIESQKNSSQRDIAYALHLEPATIVTLVDELEKMRLVVRQSPDGDRRRYRLALTESGKTKVKQIKNKAHKIDNALKSKFSHEEILTFNRILDELTSHLNNWKGGENEIPGTKRHMAT